MKISSLNIGDKFVLYNETFTVINRASNIFNKEVLKVYEIPAIRDHDFKVIGLSADTDVSIKTFASNLIAGDLFKFREQSKVGIVLSNKYCLLRENVKFVYIFEGEYDLLWLSEPEKEEVIKI